MDEALQETAKEYSNTPTDRTVRDDIAFPSDEGEYHAVGKNAILLLAAVTHDPAELPLASVYLEKNGEIVELRKIGSFLCRSVPNSEVEKVLGAYRENAFYLLPTSAYFQDAKLVIDFARNRTGFQLIQFPEEIKVHFINADPDRGQVSRLSVSDEAVDAMVLREYGVDLKKHN